LLLLEVFVDLKRKVMRDKTMNEALSRVPRRILEKIQVLTLQSDTRRVLNDGLTYLSASKLRRFQKAINLSVREGVPGDLLEFGVALGGSSILLAKHATSERKFHGFDVFGMIPAPTSEKDDEKSYRRYKEIRSGKSKGISQHSTYYGYRDNLYEEVKASLARYGYALNGESIQLHKGLFADSWPSVEIDRVAFAHIDCDWYDPVSYCLNAVSERISYGGIIVIDDYNDYDGAKTAVDEFLAIHKEFDVDLGANLVLRKRSLVY
jgi:O-methyltransferase